MIRRVSLFICGVSVISTVAWAVTDFSASKIHGNAVIESSELRASKIHGIAVIESGELRVSKIAGYAVLENLAGPRSHGYIFGANDTWPTIVIKEDRCETAA